MNRQQFLKLLSLSAGGLYLSPLLPLIRAAELKPRRPSDENIIILGAGLAGLAAAYELKKLGYKVTLLEAQLRPGGRVQTLRNFSDSLYADAGAARIPDNHDLTMKYIREFNLDVTPFYPDEDRDLSYVHYMNGKRLFHKPGEELKLKEYPVKLKPEEEELTVYSALEGILGSLIKETGISGAPGWPPENVRMYDNYTTAEYIVKRGYSKTIEEIYGLGWGKEYDGSLLFVLQDLAFAMNEKIRYKITGGNDLLPAAFASKLEDDIIYGAEVIAVNRNQNSAGVVYRRGGVTEKLTGSHVICTIPFTVLKDIEFTPLLSASKMSAVNSISYLPYTRVFLQVNRRYWLDEGLNGFALTDRPSEIWAPCFEMNRRRGLLEVYYKDQALLDGFDDLDEQTQLSLTLDHVDKVLPGVKKYYEGGCVKCWSKDRWVRAAVTDWKRGDVLKYYPAAGAPEGRIHFAGEHTSLFNGWMQGAFQSALRTVNEITNS